MSDFSKFLCIGNKVVDINDVVSLYPKSKALSICPESMVILRNGKYIDLDSEETAMLLQWFAANGTKLNKPAITD